MGKNRVATASRHDIIRQKNGTYTIGEELAISRGLNPATEYRSKKLALAQAGAGAKPSSTQGLVAILSRAKTPLFESKILGIMIAGVVSAYITWLYFWDLRRLPLGLIDDHEFLNFLGEDGQITWAEIPSLLMSTEVGAWGEGTRFRPGYYLARILQAKFFSVADGAWHEARLLLFFLTLTIIGYSFWLVVKALLKTTMISANIRLLLSGAATAASVLMASSFRSWGEIIPRLGPSELQVALGGAFIGLAVVSMFTVGDRVRYWALGLLGITLAVTSKENSVILLVPLVALFALRADFSRAVLAKLLFAGGAIAVSGWVALGVALGIDSSGADVYGNTRNSEDFWTAAVKNPYLGWGLLVVAVALFIENRSRIPSADPGKGIASLLVFGRTYTATVVAILMVVVLTAENFIYQQDVYPGIFEPARYGLISELGLLVSFLALSALSIRVLLVARPKKPNFVSPISLSAIALVLIYSGLQFEAAVGKHPQQSLESKNGSGYVHGVLRATANELSKSSTGQLVMLPGAPTDFELISALPIFLELYTSKEVSFFISPAYGPESTKDPFWISIMDEIDRISEEGRQGGIWRVSPLRELNRNSPVVCFWFVEELTSVDCSATFGIR